MDVSIIIVNYNTRQLLKACVESIYEQTEQVDFEIIVVDNASSDGSKECIETNFPQVKLIESVDNLGFGRANNLGVTFAKGQFIFFLNSDTVLINNAVKILVDFLRQNDKVAICGGNLYDVNLLPATSFSQLMPGFGAELDYFLGNAISRLKFGKNLNFNYTDSPVLVNGFISGADMMVRKTVFLDVGGFDKDFFMYYEETELTYRIRNNGHMVFSVPEARIIHLEGASENIKENSIKRSLDSKYKFYKKTGKLNQIYLSHLIYRLIAWQRLIAFLLLGRKNKAIYWKSLLKWENESFIDYRSKK